MLTVDLTLQVHILGKPNNINNLLIMKTKEEESKEHSETKSWYKITKLHTTNNVVRRINRTDLSLDLDVIQLSKKTRAAVVGHECDEEEFSRKYEYSENQFLGLVSFNYRFLILFIREHRAQSTLA